MMMRCRSRTKPIVSDSRSNIFACLDVDQPGRNAGSLSGAWGPTGTYTMDNTTVFWRAHLAQRNA
jgi:hypothetical protein